MSRWGTEFLPLLREGSWFVRSSCPPQEGDSVAKSGELLQLVPLVRKVDRPRPFLL